MAPARRVWRTFAACLLLCGSAGAAAQNAPFGSPGQLVAFGDIDLALDLGEAQDGQLQTDVELGFAPGLLYFFAPDLAAGIAPRIAYADHEMTSLPFTRLELALAAGFGMYFPLGGRLGLFPRAWLGAGHYRETIEVAPVLSSYVDPSFSPRDMESVVSGAFASAELVLPLQLRLGSAVYVAFGPSARLRLAFDEGPQRFRMGISGSLGGFF